MVGELSMGKADVSTGALSISTERALDIDFTQPVLLDKFTLNSRIRTQPSLNYWAYVQVFTPVGWMTIFGLLLSLSFTYLIIQFCQSTPLQHDGDKEPFGFLNAIGLVGTLQLQLSYPLLYTNRAVRILFLSTSLTCYLLYAGYTGLMTSEMTFMASPAKMDSLAVSCYPSQVM